MATYDLGKVVGDAGEKGDDGSTVWNTSTAPTYANSKYTFNISNLSGKTGLEISVNDIIFYSTYYYIVSTVNSTTVDCSTRVSIKGSDATVTIATSFGSTPSDSKVPSEKLTKDSLDAKQPTLVSGTNIKTINNNSLLGSGNITIESGSNVDIVTSWEQTLSDSKVPSEKLVKNTIDTKADSSDIPTKTSDLTNDGADGTNVFVANNDSRLSDARTPTSHTHGQVTNDGKISSTAVTVATGDNIVITDYSDSSKIKRVANILADHVKDSTAHSNIGSSASATQATINSSIDTALSNKVSKSQTSGLLKNDGTVDTTSYSTFSGSYSDLTNKPSIPSSSSDLSDGSSLVKTSSTTGLVKNDGSIMTSGTGSSNYSAGNHTHSGYQATLVSGTNIKTVNNESLLGSGNITIQGGSSVDVVTSWEATLSDSKVPSEKLVKNTIDGLSIPTKTSDLTNDGDGTNVFVKNNDSRLTDSRTPTSHTHGNLTNDGKVGSTANYFVYTTTNGAITSKQKIGNITTSGAIGSTSGLPIITTTSGVLTTGSFGTSSGTFAEGNHTHSGYISTSSTTGLIKNDGSIMTSGTGSTNYAAGNHTHSGYLSATKVTSWSSTVSDSNVPSEKLVKDYIDNQIGLAIQYIQQ